MKPSFVMLHQGIIRLIRSVATEWEKWLLQRQKEEQEFKEENRDSSTRSVLR